MAFSHTDTVYGVILAGGRSRRFGSDKCLFEYRGRPLISHVRDALAQVASTILISGSEDLVDSYGGRDQVIIDEISDGGPVQALRTVIEHVGSSYFLVVPCDMPHVSAGSLRQLVSQAANSGVLACAPVDSTGRVNPLCACYSTEILPYLKRVAGRDNPSARDLLAALPAVKRVQLSDHELLNINRLDDIPK